MFLDAMERYGQESTGREWEKICEVCVVWVHALSVVSVLDSGFRGRSLAAVAYISTGHSRSGDTFAACVEVKNKAPPVYPLKFKFPSPTALML